MSNSVDFATFCCHKDIDKLHAPGVLEASVNSHRYPFDNVIVIHQRCSDRLFNYPLLPNVRIVTIDDYQVDGILSDFRVSPINPIGDDMTHGPTAPHYWKWHVINHLNTLRNSTADYIVFSDADCYIKSQQSSRSWVEVGIELLQRYRHILIVGPGDGGQMFEAKTPEGYRLTQNVSQQLFLCERHRFINEVNFDDMWDGQMNAPGGPFQEYYWLLEGRMWRYMKNNNLWRCIVPDNIARYWHEGWH